MLSGWFGGDSSKKTNKSWRDGPATASQKSWASELGISFSPDITKGELSDLIDKKETARNRRTGGIIDKLKKEVAQLRKDVARLQKTRKKVVKKKKKKTTKKKKK